MKIISRAGVVFFAFFILSSAAFAECRITILHFSDFNSALEPSDKKLGGGERLAAHIGKIYAEDKAAGRHTIVLVGGDVIASGNHKLDRYKGEAEFRFLDAIGAAGMVLGGRDFDYGTAALEKNLKGLKITALAANILLKKGATPLFTPATYVIPLETGCRVGLVGLTSSEGGSSPANLEFTDPIEAADNYIGDLSEQSEVQIALTHIGIAKDAELAGKVPDLDLILGSADPASKGAGHCSDVGKTPVCRTPPNGTHLGRIDIVISGNKAVIERKELIPADKKAGKYKEIRGLINSYVNRL